MPRWILGLTLSSTRVGLKVDNAVGFQVDLQVDVERSKGTIQQQVCLQADLAIDAKVGIKTIVGSAVRLFLWSASRP